MSVTYFYFRAVSPESAKQKIRGSEEWVGKCDDVDIVPLKGIDHVVILGQLIALIRGEPWNVETVKTKSCWPPLETKPQNPEDYADLPPDSPWLTGPFLDELDLTVRDDLASIKFHQVPDLSKSLAQIDEWQETEEMTPSLLATIIDDLNKLAIQAKVKNEMLFVLSEL